MSSLKREWLLLFLFEYLLFLSVVWLQWGNFKKAKAKTKNSSCNWWRRNGFHSSCSYPGLMWRGFCVKNLQERQILSFDTILLIHMLAFPNYAASTMLPWHKQVWHSIILLRTLVIDGQRKTGLWQSPLSF